MLWQFQVYEKLTQLYISIYPLFFRFFSHACHYRVLARLPCATGIVVDIYALCCVCSVVSDSLQPYRLQPTRLHGIFQAKILEQIAISYSSGSAPLGWNPSLFHLPPGRQILYHRTIWEALIYTLPYIKQESIS